MIVATSISEARHIISRWLRDGSSLGLVPTMGFFHAGHLELMRTSVDQADKTVVSLFVNPTQFGPEEDLEVYPRDLEGDCVKAAQAGVDLVFCPETEEIYSPGHQTEVSLAELASGLCAEDRPGHFSGVATVVAKLFNIIRPDYAFFGEKDFQQLQIVRRMTHDLNFTVSIVGVPIVREADGLAMSSRNHYLNETERAEALVLSTMLRQIRHKVLEERHIGVNELIEQGTGLIKKNAVCELEYLAIVDERSLRPVAEIDGKCRVLGAIRVNQRIRLIDNMALYR